MEYISDIFSNFFISLDKYILIEPFIFDNWYFLDNSSFFLVLKLLKLFLLRFLFSSLLFFPKSWMVELQELLVNMLILTYSSLLVAKIWKKYFHVFSFYQHDLFRCNLCISLGSCQDKASEPKGKNTWPSQATYTQYI